MWVSLTSEDYIRAKERGIKPQTLSARVYEYHWDKETAMTKPVVDEEYQYWRDIAKDRGISHPTYSYRINKKDMTYEQAATTPLSTKGRKKGVKYESNHTV